MIVKQEEWERQNGYIYISDGEEITDNDVIMAEIDVLNISKAKCIEEEDYEKASEIQKKINKHHPFAIYIILIFYSIYEMIVILIN